LNYKYGVPNGTLNFQRISKKKEFQKRVLLTENEQPTFALFPTAINFLIAGGDEIIAARKVKNCS